MPLLFLFQEPPRVDDDSLESREWRGAWEALRVRRDLPPGPCDETCAQTGESWQYMGTFVPERGLVVHQFRHRCTKSTMEKMRTHDDHGRIYVNVAATTAYTQAARVKYPEWPEPAPQRNVSQWDEWDESLGYSDADPGL